MLALRSAKFIWLGWESLLVYNHLDKKGLYYRSAFLSGFIDLDRNKEIVVGKNFSVGLSPATITKGLIVRYGFDKSYINPKPYKSVLNFIMKLKQDIRIFYD